MSPLSLLTGTSILIDNDDDAKIHDDDDDDNQDGCNQVGEGQNGEMAEDLPCHDTDWTKQANIINTLNILGLTCIQR